MFRGFLINKRRVLLLFLFIFLFQNVHLLETSANDDLKVTLEQAHRAAIFFAQNQSEELKYWNEANLEYKFDLYDIDDSPIAYYFETIIDSKSVGYIIVGARFDLNPIFEVSESPRYEFFNEIDKGNKVYYLGAEKYLYAKNEKNLKEIVANKIRLKLIQLSENQKTQSDSSISKQISELQNYRLEGLKGNVESKIVWENYLSSNAVQALNYPNSYLLYQMNRISQRTSGITGQDSACGPTSAAMIVNYLRDTANLNVRGSAYYNGNVNLVNHLRDDMNTSFIGTTAEKWRNGFIKHLNRDMSGWSGNLIFPGQSDQFAKESFMDRIVSSRPPGVMWESFPWSDYGTVQWHWVAGQGYNQNNGDFLFGALDPDGNNASTKWYNWNNNKEALVLIIYKQN